MNLNLQKKLIVVSGGAKGVGEGIVRVLAAEGALPVIVGRSREDNQALVAELTSMGQTCDSVVAELTRPAECEKAIREVVERHGRIEGLVNNAGVNDSVGLEKGSYEAFLESLHKNLVHY